ncbi:MAG: amidase domain-containing protein, partial [Oscillospiraceae bacterium]|nr:amidase domain-containing protein [Oscillospiraceae bacterium]
MIFLEYNRLYAVRYARRWAFRRNPAYYNFDEIGGDCTNFV